MERHTSERLAEALERTRRHLHVQQNKEVGLTAPRAPAPCAYTIAISREAGADGCRVAQAIGQRLGWPVYDRELVQMLAEGMGVRTSMIEELDERRANWLRECVEAFASVPGVSQTAYVRHLVEAILTLAAHGHCVIVGRASPQILPAASTFRVRLIADLAHRVAVVEKRRGLSPADAARWVEREDRERAGFVKDHFHHNIDDARLYDMVLNTSRFSIEECASIVVEALQRMEARTPAPGRASATMPVAAGV